MVASRFLVVLVTSAALLSGCDSAGADEEFVPFETVLQSNSAFEPYDVGTSFEVVLVRSEADALALLDRFPLATGDLPEVDYASRDAVVIFAASRPGDDAQVAVTGVTRELQGADGRPGFRYHVRAEVTGGGLGTATYPVTVVTTPNLETVSLGGGVEEVPLIATVSGGR